MRKEIKDLEGYADVIAYAIDGWAWSYKAYGSYQGDYIAIIEKRNKILIYKGYYGSCSGCDWFESNMYDYDHEDDKTKTISDKEIKEYVADLDIFLEIPKSDLPDSYEDFVSLLPANTRNEYEHREKQEYFSDDDVSLKNIYEQMKERVEINNLDYLEFKSRESESSNV